MKTSAGIVQRIKIYYCRQRMYVYLIQKEVIAEFAFAIFMHHTQTASTPDYERPSMTYLQCIEHTTFKF